MAQRVKEFTGEECGLVGSGRFDDTKRVTCATYQTLHRRSVAARDLLRDVGGIIGDEIHTAPAKTFATAFERSDAYYRYGLSASPEGRSDGLDVIVTGLTGPVVASVDAKTLIDAGSLAKPSIQFVVCEQPYRMQFHTSQSKRSAEWRACEKALITESDKRNGLIRKLALRSDKPCVIFVSKVAHGKRIVDDLAHCGISAAYVHGKKHDAARKEILDRVRDGAIDVVVATSVWDEGVDMPGLRTVIMAGGGKSPIKAVQRVGRALRVSDGKRTASIYDIMDHGCATLTKHAGERIKALEKTGFVVNVVRDDEL